MKALLGILLGGALVFSFVGSALARPPYPKIFAEVYGDNAALKAAATGDKKCNICHVGAMKTNRNEYGKALSKTMTKAEFMKNMAPAQLEALTKTVKAAFTKTEGDKNAAGKTFGELLKAGELPGGELK